MRWGSMGDGVGEVDEGSVGWRRSNKVGRDKWEGMAIRVPRIVLQKVTNYPTIETQST